MALEFTWDFHCNSSPRSISVDVAPPVPTSSATSGGGGSSNNRRGGRGGRKSRDPYAQNIGFTSPSAGGAARDGNNNPFDDAFAAGGTNTGARTRTGTGAVVAPSPNPTLTGSSINSNPFDDAFDRTITTTTSSGLGRFEDSYDYDDDDDSFNANANNNTPSTSFSSSVMSTTTTGYTILVGTERGVIHSRTFPTKNTQRKSMSQQQHQKNRMNRFSSEGGVVHPYGYNDDGSEMSSNSNSGGGSSIPGFSRSLGRGNRGGTTGTTRNSTMGASSVHPLYKPVDATIGKNCPIIACIKATKKEMFNNGSGHGNPFASTNANDDAFASSSASSFEASNHPIYLMLQDDRRSSKVSSASTAGTMQYDPNNNDPGTFGAKLLSLNYGHGHTNQNFASPVVGNTSIDDDNNYQLPRMSSVAYHPNCGYVYGSGSSIYSLPARAVRAVASALYGKHGQPSSSYALSNPLLLPSIYYNAADILPATVRPGADSMACVCNGRVVVIAVGNSFYAVSGTNVPHGTWYTKAEEEKVDSGGTGGGQDQGQVHGHGSTERNGNVRVGFENIDDYDDDEFGDNGMSKGHDFENVLAFRQTSQVHPAIVVEIPLTNPKSDTAGGSGGGGGIGGPSGTMSGSLGGDMEEEICTSLVFLASGRECAAVELLYNPRLYSNSGHRRPTSSQDDPMDRMMLPSSSISCGSIVVGSPRHGIATLASPILAALGLQSTSSRSCGPLMAILTSDGLVHTRSPSCIAIPLSTIEVGTRPNDYFALKALPDNQVVAASYGGEGRVISFREDTVQDIADRMMKLSIDAFGSNGFPRTEFADAVDATFSATSYVGPEHTNAARTILRQYLEMILGLDISGDFGGGSDSNSWFFNNAEHEGSIQSQHVSTFLSATALLCLVCTRLSPPNPTLANRASKSCASKLGVVSNLEDSGVKSHAVKLCDTIVEALLKEAESNPSSNTNTTKKGIQIEMIEAATWLLRSCGQHQKAIEILQKRMSNPTIRNKTVGGGGDSNAISTANSPSSRHKKDGWSQLKYESFMATHLSELWSYGDDTCRDLVLESAATRQLLESNPMLGLGIFTAPHPKSSEQWTEMPPHDDPAASSSYPMKVVGMLKSIRPLIPNDKKDRAVQIQSPGYLSGDIKAELPLESGRALASSYLESLIGISSKRPPKAKSMNSDNDLSSIHDELALLLLEGVLSERGDDEADEDSDLGAIYRSKLRRLLGWANARVDPKKLMSALPASFLRERALLLGQLGRHEDALRIFYLELKSLDLALEYCDACFEKQQAQTSQFKRYPGNGGREIPESGFDQDKGCAYLPLVRVALECDKDSSEGLEAAIRVLSLRRENIDRAAALRLLPQNIPVSVLSRPFLIPALIDSESQERRLTVVSSLLRSKYIRLKHKLTEAQLKSQSSLHIVPALRSLNLDEPVHTSNPFKARASSVTTSHFPDISLVKYFFPRYVIIQAMVTNSATGLNGKSLGDVQLIVAESSDEALLPSINVPIKTLPFKMTGSSWCVLAASPQRLDGTAILACELRYRVLEVDIATGAPLSFSGSSSFSRSFVEEIQDIEIRRAEFKLREMS